MGSSANLVSDECFVGFFVGVYSSLTAVVISTALMGIGKYFWNRFFYRNTFRLSGYWVSKFKGVEGQENFELLHIRQSSREKVKIACWSYSGPKEEPCLFVGDGVFRGGFFTAVYYIVRGRPEGESGANIFQYRQGQLLGAWIQFISRDSSKEEGIRFGKYGFKRFQLPFVKKILCFLRIRPYKSFAAANAAAADFTQEEMKDLIKVAEIS